MGEVGSSVPFLDNCGISLIKKQKCKIINLNYAALNNFLEKIKIRKDSVQESKFY
jgi:hypothetical protein